MEDTPRLDMPDMSCEGNAGVGAAQAGRPDDSCDLRSLDVEGEVEAAVSEPEVPCEFTCGVAGSWAYVAGFFDGEGTIIIKRGNTSGGYGFHFSIAQSHARGLAVLRRIQAFFASNGIKSAVYTARPDDCNSLYISKRSEIEKVLLRLMPYLIVKKTESQDVLRYMKIFPARANGAALGMMISEGRRAGIARRKAQ